MNQNKNTIFSGEGGGMLPLTYCKKKGTMGDKSFTTSYYIFATEEELVKF